MKIVAGLVLFFITNNIIAQTDSVALSMQVKTGSQKNDSIVVDFKTTSSDLSGFDKIKLESGDSLIVNIIAETQTEVAFKYPLNTMINKMLYIKIKEIAYKDGKVRVFRNQAPVTGVGAEPDNLWRIVVITFNESDVEGLKEIGSVAARAEGKTIKTSQELLEKNAKVTIQKKAVRMNATKVLITKKDLQQAYGELPVLEMEGKAYGAQ